MKRRRRRRKRSNQKENIFYVSLMRDITYPQAIEIALQSKEPNNIYVAYAEGLLGEIFFSKGKFREAALTFKRARLAGLRETLRRQ